MTWESWKCLGKQAQHDVLAKKFDEYMLGNQDAVDLLLLVYDTAHIWDDLIDKDNPVDDDAISRSYVNALVSIPSNAFYRQYPDQFLMAFKIYIDQWLSANQLEKGGINALHHAFVLKETMMGFITQCAYLVGGIEHMQRVSNEIQELTMTDQNFSEYLAEKRYA